MKINPLFGYFKNSVVQPLVEKGTKTTCLTNKSLAEKIGQAAFSGLGNWPFYGVAAAFGKMYSSFFGALLGSCEFVTYFTFRMRNFEELRQKFSDSYPRNEATLISSLPSTSEELTQRLLPSGPRSDSFISQPSFPWKEVAKKTTISALGFLAQFPFMVLVYYGNGKKWIYSAAVGFCEGTFTILSLLMSLKSLTPRKESDPERERERKIILEQIDRFLEELPSKYEDPDFIRKIEDIFINPSLTEEQRSQALFDLILQARGLPELKKGPRDGMWNLFAKGLGISIALYLTTLNGAVSYRGIKEWKKDQEVLAVLTTLLVSLTNIHLLTQLCVDSAVHYYEGLRDFAKGQYRLPLAGAVSPVAWRLGRIVSIALSWLSFGTTAYSTRYIPKAEKALTWPSAPISSALVLHDPLSLTSDDLILWTKSRKNSVVKQFNRLNQNLSSFKDKVKHAHPESIKRFVAAFPHLREFELRPRPKADSEAGIPLLPLRV